MKAKSSVTIYKQIILFTLFFLFLVSLKAQKHNNEIVINGQVSIGSDATRPGLGGFVEALYGTGKSAQFSFTAGVFVFHGQPRLKPGVVTQVIPFQIGYKQNFKKFFLQPQAGYGALNGKIPLNGDVSRPSLGAFFYGLKLGGDFKKIKFGISFQQTEALLNNFKFSACRNFLNQYEVILFPGRFICIFCKSVWV